MKRNIRPGPLRARTEKGIREVRPGVYEVVAHVDRDPLTGRIRQISRTTRDGVAGARKLRAQLITEVAQGKHGLPMGPTTFGALLDEWLESSQRTSRWAPSTRLEPRQGRISDN